MGEVAVVEKMKAEQKGIESKKLQVCEEVSHLRFFCSSRIVLYLPERTELFIGVCVKNVFFSKSSKSKKFCFFTYILSFLLIFFNFTICSKFFATTDKKSSEASIVKSKMQIISIMFLTPCLLVYNYRSSINSMIQI